MKLIDVLDGGIVLCMITALVLLLYKSPPKETIDVGNCVVVELDSLSYGQGYVMEKGKDRKHDRIFYRVIYTETWNDSSITKMKDFLEPNIRKCR